jgi:hypothetical protein
MEVSDLFSLGKGHAQGPSLLLYNLVASILIFKIELNPNIEKIKSEDEPFPANLIQANCYEEEGFGRQTQINPLQMTAPI